MTNVKFITTDLFAAIKTTVKCWGKLDKLLLDPLRARALMGGRALHVPFFYFRKLCMSRNPKTFVRDTVVLAGKEYRFRVAGVMNLFAQTAHVEAIGR